MPPLIQPAHLGFSRPPKSSFGFFLREIPIALVGVVFLVLLFINWNPALQSAAATDRASTSENAGFSQGEMIARAPLVSSPFRHNQPLADRLIAMTRLEQMQSSALPVLLASLSDPDPTIRVASIQVLGWIRSREAALALERATFDPLPDVREAAIRALAELDLLQALPRLQELQVVQSNFYVQEAAYLGEQKLNAQVAAALGLGPSQIQALSVASSTGWAFAMTSNGLYAKQDGDWHPVENLPGLPTGVIITNSDGKLVYAGTLAGLFKSMDGGESWQLIPIQLPLASSVRATAVALDPLDNQKVFIALVATSPSSSVPTTSLGVYSSSDGGISWSFLQDSPRDYITTRLVLDRSLPGYLFGATGIGTWRYELDGHFVGSHPN
jgi:hypothetical protein